MRSLLIISMLFFLAGCGRHKPVSYQEQIQPILDAHCVGCHSTQHPLKKIDLSSYSALMASRASISGKQPLIIPGSPAESRLYVLCATTQSHFKMPPDSSVVVPVPVQQLDLLKKWIEQGAKAD